MADEVAVGYDAVYAAWRSSPTFHALWARHAADGDVAPGFEHLNFAPVGQLEHMAAVLRIRPGERLIDIACGAGGPGLWIARQGNARLVGLDLSSVGTRLADQRARRLGIADATFVVGSATSLGLVSGSASGVMSVDSLQYVRDKRAAFAEIVRVLSPSGRLAFTAFELDAAHVAGLPVLGDDPVDDYRPILDKVGLVVDSYDETPGWAARLAAAYQAVVTAEGMLRAEMGDAAMDALLLEISLTLAVRPYRRRVFASAHRP